ncbi:MAG: sigma-54-dependent Fis family transcriptional regulator [Kiritimatiellae bacterium]|nr:sigma-54-dependent Fis family transcriptional regulator [Kiritimatiellia bacterium]
MSKVLLVDDEPRILLLLQSLLKTNKYEVATARDGNAALDIVRAGGIDIMITDLRMTPMDGMTLFQEVHKLHPSMPVILLTAYASVETAIEAMKQGMFDYLTKPFKVDDILACLARAEEKVKKHESVALSMDIDTPLKYRFENLIGSSPLMTQVCDMIQKVAPTAATVLINGESGTGKEVIARTIHKNSPRAGKPWVAVNCAALPENLLESEMFGHMKGSFTGAYSDKQGLFEVANGGTLFLDEISSMPLLLQGKLLRVLQEREIRRVGGTKNIPVDVRVIAASNTNLEQAVVKGTFRSDLYYRFAVITIDIPPLRERKDDIIPLARHFIRLETPEGSPIPTIAADTAESLMAYSWPGNVRELENAIKHALTFLSEGDITPDLLPPKILQHARAATAAAAPADAATAGNASLKSFLKQKEKEYIEHILVAAGGDKAKAADALKVNLSTLYRKLSDDPKEG